MIDLFLFGNRLSRFDSSEEAEAPLTAVVVDSSVVDRKSAPSL